MIPGQCIECRFYQKLDQPNLGQCHRYPPTAFMTKSPLGSDAITCYFPMVQEKNFWCGEFEPKGNILTQ